MALVCIDEIDGAGRWPIWFPTMEELEHLGVGFVSLTEALDLVSQSGCHTGRSNFAYTASPNAEIVDVGVWLKELNAGRRVFYRGCASCFRVNPIEDFPQCT